MLSSIRRRLTFVMKRILPFIAGVLLIALLASGTALVMNYGIGSLFGLPEGVLLTEVTRPTSDEGDASDPFQDPIADRHIGRSKDHFIKGILGRNIFDSSAIGVITEIEGGDGPAATDLNVRLVATIVARPEEYSAALIADEARGGATTGYGLEDIISGRTIVKIEQRRVTLDNNGTLEYLSIDDEVKKVAGSTAEPVSDEEGIEKLGENSYAISRDMLDKYISDIDSISRLARALPHKGPGGEVDGYRLSGIRRNSLPEKLGLRNGDVIHSVNGQPLTSPQGALGAYQALQSDANFNFDVTRRGQKVGLGYEIR